jgi:hypothetical protein
MHPVLDAEASRSKFFSTLGNEPFVNGIVEAAQCSVEFQSTTAPAGFGRSSGDRAADLRPKGRGFDTGNDTSSPVFAISLCGLLVAPPSSSRERVAHSTH